MVRGELVDHTVNVITKSGLRFSHESFRLLDNSFWESHGVVMLWCLGECLGEGVTDTEEISGQALAAWQLDIFVP
jgi:hypothetical protein